MYLSINEFLIILSGALASIMYVWLGVGYALSVMLIITLLGYSVTKALPEILLTQFVISVLGSYLRGKLSSDLGTSLRNGAVIAISAYASFISALLLGIKLHDVSRLLAIVAILMVASFMLIIRKGGTDPVPKVRQFKLSLVTGVLAGVVKGVIGAAVTPVMLVIQRVGGLSIDEGLLRSLLAESAICLTAFVPYVLTLKFSLAMFTYLLIGSLIGALVGYALIGRRGASVKVLASSLAMLVISGILLIKVLLTTLYGGAT